MGNTTKADLLLLVLQRLTMNGLGPHKATLNIAKRIEGRRSLGQKIICGELWICAACMAYSLMLFAKGIMWKRALIVPFILSMLYVISLPFGTSISALLTDSSIRDKLPSFVADMLGERGCALILGLAGTLFVLTFYSYFRFTPMLILVFCIKSISASMLNIDSFALSLLFLIVTLALFISYKKQFYHAENLVVALLFCLSGSMLFLSLCSLSTGHPYLFMSEEPRASHFVFWLGLCFIGFLLQINTDTAFK